MRNPIYIFYENININTGGRAGQPDDKHYKCYHGNHKILTITQAMKSSLNGNLLCFSMSFKMKLTLNCVGLIGHLKNHFPPMYHLYLILKDRSEPPTEEEKAITSIKQMLDPSKATKYLEQLQRASTGIIEAFKNQHQNVAVCFHLCSQDGIRLNSIIAGAQLGPRRIWKAFCPMDSCM